MVTELTIRDDAEQVPIVIPVEFQRGRLNFLCVDPEFFRA